MSRDNNKLWNIALQICCPHRCSDSQCDISICIIYHIVQFGDLKWTRFPLIPSRGSKLFSIDPWCIPFRVSLTSIPTLCHRGWSLHLVLEEVLGWVKVSAIEEGCVFSIIFCLFFSNFCKFRHQQIYIHVFEDTCKSWIAG